MKNNLCCVLCCRYGKDRKKFLEREKALSKTLRHEGIVVSLGLTTKREVGKTVPEELDCTYLVMELCQCNLRHLLEELKSAQRELKEWETSHIIKHILKAISYMHDKEVIHRYNLTKNTVCYRTFLKLNKKS